MSAIPTVDDARADIAQTPREPVAIVGIGCRLPGGARSPEGFWSNLLAGVNGVVEVPPDRWSLEGFYDAVPGTLGRSTTKWGGFLDDIDRFDAGFFGISPREAAEMDPQQRLMLQVAWEALEDAGIAADRLKGSSTGVFVGVSVNDYATVQKYHPIADSVHAGTGTALCIVANRISHRFDFHGPSLAVDTACSSSMVAVDQACRSLRDGDCEVALAGGVNALLEPGAFLYFSSAGMMSTDGKVHAFDAEANGFVRAEGGGIVVLKRLADAQAAGDRIYAVIRATTVNQDGSTSTMTQPNPEAHAAMLEQVCRRGGVTPEQVVYVEAHGTGTPVGDPIEASAIGRVFGKARPAGDPIRVGSVKTQTGHLESGAGVTGLIKTTLALYHGTLPASLNFNVPNPAIPFDELNIEVVTKPTPVTQDWPLAVVNSFGIGGTNACALLERAPQNGAQAAPSSDARRLTLVPLSAASPKALKARAADLARMLGEAGDAAPPLGDLAGTLALRRSHLNQRLAVIAGSTAELAERLAAFADDQPMPGQEDGAPAVLVTGRREEPGATAFVFAGQGGQSWDMARELLTDDPVFRAAVDAFDEVFKDIAGWSAIEALMADEASSRIHSTDVTQPAIFAVQIGLVARWRDLGIEPDMVIGHSFGEVAAAYTAGAIGLEDAAQIIYHRGRLQDETQGAGTMAALAMSAEDVRQKLAELGETKVEVAADNGPQMVTIAGDKAALTAFIENLQAADPDLFCRLLKVDYGAHSHQMDVIRDVYVESLGGLRPKPATLPMISTVTGRLLEPDTLLDADYWWRNVREPVLFRDALDAALEAGVDTFVEMGPHATLSGIISSGLMERGAKGVAVPSLHAKHGDLDQLLASLAILHVRGHPVRFEALVDPDHQRVGLPAYPWELQRYWADSEEARAALVKPRTHPLLGERGRGQAAIWANEINLKTHKFIDDHRVDGSVVFPGAGYVEMMLAAAVEGLGELPVELEGVVFHEALFIQDEQSFLFETHYDPTRRQLQVFTRLRDGDPEWTLRAAARVRHGAARVVPFGSLEATSAPVARAEIYQYAQSQGHQYGPLFQGVDEVRTAPGASLGRVSVPEALAGGLDAYHVHPAILDACLQVGIGLHGLALDADRQRSTINLPTGARQLRVFKRPTSPLEVSVRLVHEDDRGAACDVVARDAEGDLVLIIDGFKTRKLASRTARAGKTVAVSHCQEFWQESALDMPSGDGLSGTWLVLADTNGTGATLAGALAARGASPVLVDAGPAFAALEGGGFHIRPDSPEDMEQLIETVAGRHAELAGIVDLWSLHEGAGDPVDGAALMQAQAPTVFAALHLVQALAKREALAPRLYLAMRGAHLLPVEETPSQSLRRLALAPLVGFARTAANEQPQLRLTLVDLDPEATNNGEGAVADLMAEILADTPELEVALRGEHRYVNRVDVVPPETLPRRRVGVAALASSGDYRLTMPAPGVFEAMLVGEMGRVEASPDRAVVDVRAAGLNFRDVLAAAGLLPEGAEDIEGWRMLGIEFAGVVRAVGPDVTTLAPGDRVMGSAKGCIGSAIAVPAVELQRIPDSVAFTAGATVPAVFMTAHYALNHVARMAEGDKVLIHVATGGVGLAAIQLARQKGCEIFATAGTDEKRAYLRSIGIDHVMNSRTLDFADEIMAATGGRGVDIVLNSLPGPFIDKGLGILAPYGRFLEIGKRDLFADKPIGLASLKNSNSFVTVNLEAMGRERPAVLQQIFGEVATMLAEGRIEPLPTNIFPLASAAEAFRFMSQARHIGKVVIEIDESKLEVALDPERPLALAADGAYLVTGGLGGFGLEVARSLGQAGAGQLVLVSRSGAASDEAKAAVAELEAAGTVVTIVAGDVTDPVDVGRAVAAAGADGRRLKGVVHAAMVLDDGFITQLDRARFETALKPKMLGGWNLHQATLDEDLDFFVVFSSVASLLGSTGQANYVAGNAFLEKLAGFRRAAGLPGTALAWGALGGKGIVARNAAIANYLDSQGIVPLELDEALAAFGRVLRLDPGSVAVIRVDWQKLGKAQVALTDSPRVGHLLQRDDAGGRGGRFRAELVAAPAARRPVLLARFLKAQVARVLRVEAAEIDSERPLSELGLDSLTSFELKNRVESELGVTLPASKFLQKPTVATLGEAILDSLGDDPQAAELDIDEAAEAPLSAEQAYLWRYEREAPASLNFNVNNRLGIAIAVRPALDLDRLSEAFDKLVEENEMLRACFAESEDGPVLRVLDRHPQGLVLTEQDAMSEDELEELVNERILAPYDLERGPMIRLEVLRQPDSTDVVVLSAHHAVLDGWSATLVMSQLFMSYFGIEPDEATDDSGPRATYADFTRWQRAFIASPAGRKQLDYWVDRLRDAGPPLELPADHPPRPNHRLGIRKYGAENSVIGKAVTKLVKKLAAEQSTTRYVVLLSAFKLLLFTYTGRRDLLVSATTSARNRKEFENVIGEFFNFVVFRSAIDPQTSFRDFVDAVAATVIEALDHQEYPYPLVFEAVQPDFVTRRTALDQVGFLMQRPDNVEDHGLSSILFNKDKVQIGPFEIKTFPMSVAGIRRDLLFVEMENDGQIHMTISYNGDMFEQKTAVRLLEDYMKVVRAVVSDPDSSIADVLGSVSLSAVPVVSGE